MIVNYGKKIKEKKISQKSTMPPVLSVILVAVLICFIVIAKGLTRGDSAEATVPVLSAGTLSNASEQIEPEQDVLTMLREVLHPSERVGQAGRKEKQATIYYEILKNYLSGDGIELTNQQAKMIDDNIVSIHEILTNEEKVDYTQLSYDGKRVVFYLLKQIYDICGLQLTGNMEDNIETITQQSGIILYNNNLAGDQSNLQIDALIIILLLLVILFIICLLIARKHQLFNKEEKRDGFDEERFA